MQRIGYMIYETAEGEKNRGFVSMFAQAGKAYGLILKSVCSMNVMEFWYFILVISFVPGMIKR